MRNQAVVIGASAGGLEALRIVLAGLGENFPAPVIIVQHLSPESDNFLTTLLANQCRLRVKEAEEKELLQPGCAYVAPPNYHLLVELDHTLTLSVDARVNFSRPAIDVLFETAAEAYGDKLVGVILTGANEDGSLGLQRIKSLGGTTVVQDPRTAVEQRMPLAAIAKSRVDYVVPLTEIGVLIKQLVEG